MPKIVFDKRETELWLTGKSEIQNQNTNSKLYEIPNGWTYEEWRVEVAKAINILGGHMGGFGVDLVDEEGNSLPNPNVSFEGPFQYAPPDKTYTEDFMSKKISVFCFKKH